MNFPCFLGNKIFPYTISVPTECPNLLLFLTKQNIEQFGTITAKY